MRRRWALGAFRTPRSAWPLLPPLTTSHFTLWRRWSRGTKADNAAVPDHRSGRTTVLARWHNNESAVTSGGADVGARMVARRQVGGGEEDSCSPARGRVGGRADHKAHSLAWRQVSGGANDGASALGGIPNLLAELAAGRRMVLARCRDTSRRLGGRWCLGIVVCHLLACKAAASRRGG